MSQHLLPFPWIDLVLILFLGLNGGLSMASWIAPLREARCKRWQERTCAPSSRSSRRRPRRFVDGASAPCAFFRSFSGPAWLAVSQESRCAASSETGQRSGPAVIV